MTCPVCGKPTEITRDPTPEERRALASLKLAARYSAAKLRVEKMAERGRTA